jgi:hypothetical protein
MPDESNVTPTDEAAAPDLETRVDKLEDEVADLESKSAQDNLPNPPAAESAASTTEPNNEGENLERTETNPTIDPHQPGVEPDDAPVNSGPNAPASTDPEGDTAKQNAPEVPAPEPDGPNVTTNPGTDSTSDAQTEVPQPETVGTGNEPGGSDIPPVGTASDEAEPPAGPTDTPDPEATPEPAADASEKPLYVYVGEDDSYTVPAGYMASGLVTPEGKVLYHYTDDEAGEPATGAIDGELGIYADDAVPTVG